MGTTALVKCLPSSSITRCCGRYCTVLPCGGAHEPVHCLTRAACVVQHFRKLTKAFLSPFKPYFRMAKTMGTASLGPYDRLADVVLPTFTQKAFLQRLERRKANIPAPFRKAKWKALYTGFITSPNFWPWFNARRAVRVVSAVVCCRRECGLPVSLCRCLCAVWSYQLPNVPRCVAGLVYMRVPTPGVRAGVDAYLKRPATQHHGRCALVTGTWLLPCRVTDKTITSRMGAAVQLGIVGSSVYVPGWWAACWWLWLWLWQQAAAVCTVWHHMWRCVQLLCTQVWAGRR